jgi:hypothetical protein
MTFVAAMVTAIGLSLAGSAQAVLNLVNNGSFETGDFTGWTLTGNTGFMGVQCPGPGPTVAQGNCSAFAGPVGSIGTLSQNLSLVVGNHYFLTFAFLPDGGTPSSFSATLAGTTLVNLNNPAASASFRNFAFAFTATAATEALAFNFRDDPGFLFLDAVSVIPEPASVGLLGIALAAMFAGLRRRIR